MSQLSLGPLLEKKIQAEEVYYAEMDINLTWTPTLLFRRDA